MPTQAIRTILQLTGSLQTISGIVLRLPLRCVAGGPTNPFPSNQCDSNLPRQGIVLPDTRPPTRADDNATTATRLFDSHPLVGSLYWRTPAPTGNGKFSRKRKVDVRMRTKRASNGKLYVTLLFNRCQQEFFPCWNVLAFAA